MKTTYKSTYAPYLVKNPLLFFYLKCLFLFSFCFYKRKRKSVTPKKILLCNLAHRGDIILASSVLPAIKKAFPEALIGFLMGSVAKEFLTSHRCIDKIHVFDHFKLQRDEKSIFKKATLFIKTFYHAFLEIKKEKYDLYIDLYLFYPNGNMLSFFLGIPERWGYTSGGGEGFLSHRLQGYDQKKHMLDHYKDLLKELNIIIQKEGELKPNLCLQEKKIPIPFKHYWIFHPFSGSSKKDREISFWQDLLTVCLQKGINVVVTGSGKEQIEKINFLILNKKGVVSLAGKTDLYELVYLVKNSQGVVCADSMIAHLANAYSIQPFVATKEVDNLLWVKNEKKISCAKIFF